jgi:hypothetical protein
MDPAQQLKLVQRTADVVELRSEGVSFKEIGRRLDVSPQRAYQIWQKALIELPNPKLVEHRASQLAAIDLTKQVLFKIAFDESKSTHARVEACNSIKGFLDREAKLTGTDMPSRKELTVISQDVVDAEIQKLTAELELAGVQTDAQCNADEFNA